MTFHLVFFGAVMSALTLGIYFLALVLYADPATATTMAFLTLGLNQLFHAFNVRSSSRSVLKGLFSNKWMHFSFVLSVLLQILVVVIEPVAVLFKVKPLMGVQWLYVLAASFVIVPISEATKLIKRLITGRGKKRTDTGRKK